MLSPFVFQSIVATPYWEQNLLHYDFPIDLVLGRIPKESPSQEVGFVVVDVGVRAVDRRLEVRRQKVNDLKLLMEMT